MAISKNDRRIMLEILIEGLANELEFATRRQKKALQRFRRVLHTDISPDREREIQEKLNIVAGEVYSCEKRLRHAERVFSQLF